MVDEVTIQTDFFCRRCEYNLRGLVQGGRCPECGESIDVARAPGSDFARVFNVGVPTLVLCTLLIITLLFDCLLAVTASKWYVLIVGLLGASVALPSWRRSRSRVTLTASMALLLALVVLPYVPWPARKPFLCFYKSIRNGMNQTQVIAQLDNYFPNRAANRWPSVRGISANHMILVLNEFDGRYNAEIVGVQFKNGRVVSKKWSPD